MDHILFSNLYFPVCLHSSCFPAGQKSGSFLELPTTRDNMTS